MGAKNAKKRGVFTEINSNGLERVRKILVSTTRTSHIVCMGKRRRILLAALLVAVLGGLGRLAWQVRSPHEPTYRGVSLSTWLEQGFLNNPSVLPDLNNAIRHAGTNANRVLLKMAMVRDSTFKRTVIEFGRKQPLLPFHPFLDEEYHEMARYGFSVLGPAAKPIVPELIELLKDKHHAPDVAVLLGAIGPDAESAIPALIEASQNPGDYEGWEVSFYYALGEIQKRPDLVIPVLMASLSDTNKEVLEKATYVLGAFGTNALVSVPRLRQLAIDSDIGIRLAAVDSLGRIAPDSSWDVAGPVCIGILADTNSQTADWHTALRQLHRFGGHSKEAVPVLLSIATNSNDLSQDAANALKRIDPETAANAGIK